MRAPSLRRIAVLAAVLSLGAAGRASAQETKKVAIDAFLKGTVTSFDGSAIEVRYDLADAAQLDDFPTFKAFQIADDLKHRWVDKNLVLDGTGSLVWKPVLKRKAEMEFDLRLRVPRDFGAYIAEERRSDEMTVFSIWDQFFQNKDHPGQAKTHMIARFTLHAADAGGDYAFRYVTRKPGPALDASKYSRIRLGKDGVEEWLEIDGQKLQGSENNWPQLRGYRPGFYLIESGAHVANIVMRGEIDPKWADENGIDLSLPVKVKSSRPGERTPSEADFAARKRIEGVRNGVEGPNAVLKMIEDASLVDDTREAAAKAVEEAGDMKVVRVLVTTMESPDLLARKLALRIVAKLTGKSFGFVPDGPEADRHKAVRSLLDWIEKNPGKFK